MKPISYMIVAGYYLFFFWCLPSLNVASIRKKPWDYLKTVLALHIGMTVTGLILWVLLSLPVVRSWLHLVPQ